MNVPEADEYEHMVDQVQDVEHEEEEDWNEDEEDSVMGLLQRQEEEEWALCPNKLGNAMHVIVTECIGPYGELSEVHQVQAWMIANLLSKTPRDAWQPWMQSGDDAGQS